MPSCIIPNEDAAACSDANIVASNYDQSCTSDSDCVALGFGNLCAACEIGCPNGTINKSAVTQYRADTAKSAANGADCGCPISTSPCCLGGRCMTDCGGSIMVFDAGTEARADTGPDAATDAAADASAE